MADQDYALWEDGDWLPMAVILLGLDLRSHRFPDWDPNFLGFAIQL